MQVVHPSSVPHVLQWPLFYPIASGIGTLQAGFVMGWSSVVSGALLLVVQVLVLAGVWWSVRTR